MSTRLLGPFNRVEGDLRLKLELANGKVVRAEVGSPLFRGFERILTGRHALDALTIVPRICGICSVSQSVAAVHALEALYGVHPPPNGEHVRNLIHAVENVADHLTHFMLFFMPDFARDTYRERPWHARAVREFKAQTGQQHAPMLEARATLMRFMGTLAGHWPHTLSLQPGGVTRTVGVAERARLGQRLKIFTRYLEGPLFGCPLLQITELDSYSALDSYTQKHPAAAFAFFLELAQDTNLAALGRTDDALIAAAAYRQGETAWSPAGRWQNGQVQPLNTSHISEDVDSSFFAGEAQHPFTADTVPVPGKAGAYSWNRAPRLAGQRAQTGALARALMRSEPLLLAMMAYEGSSVRSRVVARVTEMARLVLAMQNWLAAIEPDAPFALPCPLAPLHNRAEGLTEAARGMLGHWVTLENERILRYQIIAPTGWNFSPRDRTGQPGPLEHALHGTTADDHQAIAVQHIVRSFDPCQVCTTH